jgi:hypothetical protein
MGRLRGEDGWMSSYFVQIKKNKKKQQTNVTLTLVVNSLTVCTPLLQADESSPAGRLFPKHQELCAISSFLLPSEHQNTEWSKTQ